MVNITQGRSRSCKDSIGGVNNVYLFSYYKYGRSQIITTDLVLTSFPDTTIYQYETTNEPIFDDKGNEDEGGKYYEQSISLEFTGIELYDEFETFLKKDIRCIIRDRNGIYRLLGAYKGLEVEKLEVTTGAARNEFRGYRFTLNGKEEKPALFINNLEDAGFTIAPNNWLALEDSGYLLTQDNKLIEIEE